MAVVGFGWLSAGDSYYWAGILIAEVMHCLRGGIAVSPRRGWCLIAEGRAFLFVCFLGRVEGWGMVAFVRFFARLAFVFFLFVRLALVFASFAAFN